ncbi:phosphoserine phosphatase SerB [Paremcibacter congregatus]|uniref:Phosphoserine phosphatase n=1 Tax=Paremcibacter congregatus TaxID=2043170 RepID=A0A2G4YRK7_9PROT|nr:phosphoserine phosphatase SerB [Paremcibacter congregatus]PHZ84948.1 phosphoserine phosphatase SerB [Paremcibacter congregatus]QDE26077.1 phosphoserine phosphatase SerB [Paremcibacter congregatus]
MSNILTLIANPATPSLTEDVVSGYATGLVGVSGLRWLSEGVAVDIHFDSDLDTARQDLQEDLLTEDFDFAFQAAEDRTKKLLVADMDSTIIQCECIDELADYAGLKPKVAAITEAAMRGDLDFESALRERVGLLKGMEASVLETVYQERVRLMPGAEVLIKTMNAKGANTVLVSGGFTFFTGKVAAVTGFQTNRANVLEIKDGKLTGQVMDPVVDSSTKLNSLKEFRQLGNLSPAQVMAVGDGANDIPMIREAGVGIAYHPHPAAAEAADITLRHADLTALLYLQGYADEDFITS